MTEVLVLGASGQLGNAMRRTDPGRHSVYFAVERVDLTDADAIRELLQTHASQVVINCAAYTKVDQAEEEREAAYAVNATGAGNIAEACREANAALVHISTDFVFDGNHSIPYKPHDSTHPCNVYGASKLAGEQRIAPVEGLSALVIRTSWLYDVSGNNFVKTMLRLMRTRPAISVVNDQTGLPTSATGLAEAIWQLVDCSPMPQGILHYTDVGEGISWYDFAVAIQAIALDEGLLKAPVEISPIGSVDYPTAANRPAYSVLDCTQTDDLLGQIRRPWQERLRTMLKALKVEEDAAASGGTL